MAEKPRPSSGGNPQVPEGCDAHELAERLHAAILDWEADPGNSLSYTERSWRIAEALHRLTWLHPHSLAPLCLLLDEEAQFPKRG